MKAKKHLVIGVVKYPVELDSSLPCGEWYLKENTMFNLDEEDLKRVARNMGKAAAKVRERLLKDAMFGKRVPYSPFVSTGVLRSSMPFRSFIPLWTVITSPYVVERKRHGREKKRTFWQRLWTSLADLNPWPYSPIEYYEVEMPAIMIDRPNYQIICHPSLEQKIKAMIEAEGINNESFNNRGFWSPWQKFT